MVSSKKNLPNVQNEGGRESKVFLNFKKNPGLVYCGFSYIFSIAIDRKNSRDDILKGIEENL